MRVRGACIAAIIVICASVLPVLLLSSCKGKGKAAKPAEVLDDENKPAYMRTEETNLDRGYARQSRAAETGRAKTPEPVAAQVQNGEKGAPATAPEKSGPSSLQLPEGLPEVDPASLGKKPDDVDDPGVKIEMADGGEILIEMFATKAPKTTGHFVEIVKTGFFDGLSFHRSDDMCIQGGDATLVGKQPWGKTVDLEVSGLPFDAGSVGMARTDDPNSADSQFFICKLRAANLDKGYANFGQVLKGMKVVIALPERALGAVAGSSPIPPEAQMKKVSLVRFKGRD